MNSTLSELWSGIVADTTAVDGSMPVATAVQAYADRAGAAADLTGSVVVTEDRLSDLRSANLPTPFTLRVTGGAGAIPASCRLAGKDVSGRLTSVEVALRDLDDLPGNARRVTLAIDQAHEEGVLSDHVPVYIDIPQSDQREPSHGWLAAADEVAAVEQRLLLRTGPSAVEDSPPRETVAARLDAALDRELPFRCTRLDAAVRTSGGPDAPGSQGFLNLLLATRAAFDGAHRDEVVGLLAERDHARLVGLAGDGELARTRRWMTSFGCADVDGVIDELTSLDLLELR